MPSVNKGSKVLVSGANGYLAMWVVRTLLERGFTVRGTVRAEDKWKFMIEYFQSLGYGGDKLEVVVVDDIVKVGTNWCPFRPYLWPWPSSWIKGRSIWRGSQRCRCNRAYRLAIPFQSKGTWRCANIPLWYIILVHVVFNIPWGRSHQPRRSRYTRYARKRIKRVRFTTLNICVFYIDCCQDLKYNVSL